MIDAALGTVEKGWYHNDDAYNTQPWLPDGPIPHTVTWRLEGYEPQGVPHPGDAERTPTIDKTGRWKRPSGTWPALGIGGAGSAAGDGDAEEKSDATVG